MFGGIRTTVSKLLHSSRKTAVATKPVSKAGGPNEAVTTDGSYYLSGLPVLAVCLVDFHHSHGPNVECIYPPVLEALKDQTNIGQNTDYNCLNDENAVAGMIHLRGEHTDNTKYCFVENDSSLRLLRFCDVISCLKDIASFALPDGSHKVIGESSTLLILPTRASNIPLYAVATLNSINVKDLHPSSDDPDIYKRSVIQKSLVVISEIPFWEVLLEYNRNYCEIIFDKKDFQYAQQLMKLMTTALNHEIVCRLKNLSIADQLPPDLKQLTRKIGVDHVPLILRQWVLDHSADISTLCKRNVQAIRHNLVQDYVRQHVPESNTVSSSCTLFAECIMTLLKALLLELRVLVWGPNSSMVSSLIVYLASILPFQRKDFAIDLDSVLVLPYAPLDVIIGIPKTQPMVVGTTNSILLTDIATYDLVVILPHDDILVVSKGQGQMTLHIHPSKLPVTEIRNKKVKLAVRVTDNESKFLRAVAARGTSDFSAAKADDESSSSNECIAERFHFSPRRVSEFALGSLCVIHRGVRRSSIHTLQRASTTTNRRLQALTPSKSIEESRTEQENQAIPNDDRASNSLAYLKLSRGFKIRNFPNELVNDLETATDLRIVLQCYVEVLCRLAAFGGGEQCDRSCLTEVAHMNKMYHQMGFTANNSTSFWGLWMKTRNFHKMFTTNTLPKVPGYAAVPPRIGFARYRYANGDIYRGHFVRGLRHGTGLYRGNQVAYHGQWADDRRNGLGLYRVGKLWYAGEWNEDARCGLGYCDNDSNEVLCGEFSDNKLEGYGVYVNRTLDIRYEGQFVRGQFHGSGILWNGSGLPLEVSSNLPAPGQLLQWAYEHNTLNHGYLYQGSFVRGVFHGQGILLVAGFGSSSACPSCAWMYSGNFCHGQMDGYGEMSYADGSKYSGYWNANARTKGVFHSSFHKWRVERQEVGKELVNYRIQDAVDTGKRTLTLYACDSQDIKCPFVADDLDQMTLRLKRVEIEDMTPADNQDLILEGDWNSGCADMIESGDDSNDRVPTTPSCSGAYDQIDQNLNWTIKRVGDWQYTGGIIQDEKMIKFNGYGQLILKEGGTVECYWHNGIQQGEAVVRMPHEESARWGAWVLQDRLRFSVTYE